MNDAVHAAPFASASFSIIVPGVLPPSTTFIERPTSDAVVAAQISHSLR
jgi:hypothetical protein